LAGLEGGAAGCVAHGEQDAAQPIGHEAGGRATAALRLQCADQVTGQRVVMCAALQVAGAIVLVLFQPKGVDREAGDPPTGGALDRAIATGIVGIPALVGAGDLPFHHLIQAIVGKRVRFPTVGSIVTAAGTVALLILAQTVGQAAATVALPNRHDVGHMMQPVYFALVE
jgi:hypothetical protein